MAADPNLSASAHAPPSSLKSLKNRNNYGNFETTDKALNGHLSSQQQLHQPLVLLQPAGPRLRPRPLLGLGREPQPVPLF